MSQRSWRSLRREHRRPSLNLSVSFAAHMEDVGCKQLDRMICYPLGHLIVTPPWMLVHFNTSSCNTFFSGILNCGVFRDHTSLVSVSLHCMYWGNCSVVSQPQEDILSLDDITVVPLIMCDLHSQNRSGFAQHIPSKSLRPNLQSGLAAQIC